MRLVTPDPPLGRDGEDDPLGIVDLQGVAVRAGFTQEGVLRAREATRSGRRDSVMFSLLKDDPRPLADPSTRRGSG